MHQNLGNHDLLAWLGFEQIDVNRVAFRDAILPATSLYDCKCHKEITCPDQVVTLLREKRRPIPYLCGFGKRKGGSSSRAGLHRTSMLNRAGKAALNWQPPTEAAGSP